MPGMPGRHHRAAGPVEVWAARAWNVFNEGRPFSIVYPAIVLLAASAVGLAPDGGLGLALLAAVASSLVLVVLPVRAAGPGAALAGGARRAAAARAVARPRAARRRAGGIRVLHRGRVGLGLLPPAHRSAVDQRTALLAPGAHELRPHERERARAAAQAADRPERGHARGRGAGRRLGGARGGGRGDRRRTGRAGSAPLREAVAALSGAKPTPARARAGPARPARVRDRRRRLQPRPAVAGGRSGHGPARARGHRVPRRRAGVSRADGGLLLVDAHRRHAGRARHALELRAAARACAASRSSTCSRARVAAAGSWGSRTCSTRSARTWSAP